MKTRRIVLILLLAGTVLLFAGAQEETPTHEYSPEMDAWLKEAELGPYEGTQDWTEIEAKAREEGEVIVYSSSSRIAKVAEAFEATYPGIKVTYYDLGSVQSVEKTIQEQEAGLYNADIITTGGSGQVIYELLENNRIVNFVPDTVGDQIPKELKEPLLARITEGYIFLYNTEVYGDTPPIKNIWELTTPKWKGKSVIKTPLESLSNLMGICTIVQHADEMASAYKRLTGKEIELSPDVPDAGYEWLYRLLHNDLIILKSGSKVAAASGKKGQEAPPIAITNYTYIRYNASKDYVNREITPLDPVENIVTPIYTGIARQAAHPNAAKLMTAFLLGDPSIDKNTVIEEPYTEGRSLEILQGLAPYYEPGSKSPRDTVPLAKGGELWYQLKAWYVDPEFMWYESPKVLDFWVQEAAQ